MPPVWDTPGLTHPLRYSNGNLAETFVALGCPENPAAVRIASCISRHWKKKKKHTRGAAGDFVSLVPGGVHLLQKRNLPRSVSMRAQQCCPGPGVPSGRGALCTPQLLRAVGSWVSWAQHKRWMWRGTKGLFAFLKHQRVPPAPPHTAHRSPATPNPIPCSQRTETNVQTAIFTHSDTRIQIFGHPANAAPACPVQLPGCRPQCAFWRYKGKTPTAGRFAGEARV